MSVVTQQAAAVTVNVGASDGPSRTWQAPSMTEIVKTVSSTYSSHSAATPSAALRRKRFGSERIRSRTALTERTCSSLRATVVRLPFNPATRAPPSQ